MKIRLSSFIKNALFCQNGAVAIWISSLLFIMLLLVGANLDFGKYFIVKRNIQNALDAAVLSAVRTYNPSNPENLSLIQQNAKEVFLANLRDQTAVNIEVSVNSNYHIVGKATANYSHTVFKLLDEFIDNTITVQSEASRKYDNLEIAVVLDTSGSMNSTIPTTGNSRMNTLKTALKNLVKNLSDNTGDNVAISFIPYSYYVTLPVNAQTTSWVYDKPLTASWQGVVLTPKENPALDINRNGFRDDLEPVFAKVPSKAFYYPKPFRGCDGGGLTDSASCALDASNAFYAKILLGKEPGPDGTMRSYVDPSPVQTAVSNWNGCITHKIIPFEFRDPTVPANNLRPDLSQQQPLGPENVETTFEINATPNSVIPSPSFPLSPSHSFVRWPAAPTYNGEGCPNALLPWTDIKDVSKLNQYIEQLSASGQTNSAFGLAWGFRTISPSWKSLWPAAGGDSGHPSSDPDKIKKIIIIMTDGQNINPNVDPAAYSMPAEPGYFSNGDWAVSEGGIRVFRHYLISRYPENTDLYMQTTCRSILRNLPDTKIYSIIIGNIVAAGGPGDNGDTPTTKTLQTFQDCDNTGSVDTTETGDNLNAIFDEISNSLVNTVLKK